MGSVNMSASQNAFTRIRSIDILRGAIMVLMALDHVRVYAGVPSNGTDPALFFTRWITHFCAPGFAFLAGTSIFLHSIKLNDQKTLSRFLLGRGLLLVVLEVTLIRFFWTFNVDYGDFTLAGVIWMLGWCMVIMALLVKLSPTKVGIIGLIIILVQQAFHYVPQITPASIRGSFIVFWNFIYPAGDGPEWFPILYVIVPWIGVMAFGYGFGQVMVLEPEKRKRICLLLGLLFIGLFLVIGTIVAMVSPVPENALPFILRLLNQNKYPASQLFLLMTLGPIIALIPYAEKANGRISRILTVFGSVPMFYYLLHILLIHLSAFVVNLIRSGQTHQKWYLTAPFWTSQEEGVRWELPVLYLDFALVVIVLYFACRWYGRLKKRYPESLLRFI